MKTLAILTLALCSTLAAFAGQPAAEEPASEEPSAVSSEALEILKKADEAARKIEAVRIAVTSKPTGLVANFIGATEGETLIAKSVSGRMELRVPAGRRVDLDIRTLSGKVDLPSPSSSPTPTSGQEVSVRAKSVSGNIRIDRAK